MKLYVSDNQVILTEGFDGVVPVKYFEKILSWPDGQVIPTSVNWVKLSLESFCSDSLCKLNIHSCLLVLNILRIDFE